MRPMPPTTAAGCDMSYMLDVCKALDQIKELQRWKREATVVMDRYDAIFDLIETVRPARLGDFKSDHVAAFVRDAINQGTT